MERKTQGTIPYLQVPSRPSGQFEKAKPISEPARKISGQQEVLVLDLSDLEEEPPTKKIRYIESIELLRQMLRESVPFSRVEGFDPKDFAEKLVSMGMCTTDRSGKNPYYHLEDSNGNQYRLYMNPTENITTDRVRQDKRTVLEFGEQFGVLFPLFFPKDDRVEK